jgi:site-specific DNA recombinase
VGSRASARCPHGPTCRDEAFNILRDLIERITVHPGEKGPEIELTGKIVAMVELALGSAEGNCTNNKTAFRRLALDDRSRGSVKVVAGVGFEPTTFRL